MRLPSRNDRLCIFSDAEIRLLAGFFAPEYVWDRAMEHGAGHPVVGAKAAFAEARSCARRYLRYVLDRARQKGPEEGEHPGTFEKRVRQDERFILHVMRMGERVQELEPLESGYRRLMVESHPAYTPWAMVGEAPPIRVETGTASRTVPSSEIREAVLRAVGMMLVEHPSLNRALLPPFGPNPRVWQRKTPEVVVPVEMRADDLSVVVIDPQAEDLRREMRQRFRQLLDTRRHWLAPLGDELLTSWLRRGFLASYGGAFVSDAGGYPIGKAYPIFLPGNGIPLTIAINPVHGGEMVMTITVDHRVFDASHGGQIHVFLRDRVHDLLRAT